MKDNYTDQPAIIMDFVKPKEDMGVHAFDILTMSKPDGSIQVLYSMLWADCNADTSQDPNQNYVINLNTQKIVGSSRGFSVQIANKKFDEKKLGE